MDIKVTLSFDEQVIAKAKAYAEEHNISLSRLTEVLLRRLTTHSYANLEEFPVSDWVNFVAEDAAEYQSKPRGRKKLKEEFFASKK